MSAKSIPGVMDVPCTWSIKRWPEHVYPHTSQQGRYVVNMHKRELVAAGALTRVGRELVVLGGPYYRWMQKRAERAMDWPPVPRRPSPAPPPSGADA